MLSGHKTSILQANPHFPKMHYNHGAAHMCRCYVIQSLWPIEDGADPQLQYVSNKKQLHVGGVQWILYCPHTTLFKNFIAFC